MVYFPVSPREEWRVVMIKEILHVRNGDLAIENFENEERKAQLGQHLGSLVETVFPLEYQVFYST